MKLLRNKKILLIIGIILIVVLIVVVNANDSSKKSTKRGENSCGGTTDEQYKNLRNITYKQYKCLYDNEDTFVLLVSNTECSYCEDFKPIINSYAEKNNLYVYVINYNKLVNDEVSFKASLSYFDEHEDWGVPLTLGIKNKKVISSLNGYTNDNSEIEKVFSPIIKAQSINTKSSEKPKLYKYKIDDYDFWSQTVKTYQETYKGNLDGVAMTTKVSLQLRANDECYFTAQSKGENGSLVTIQGNCTYLRQDNTLTVDGTYNNLSIPSTYEQAMGMTSTNTKEESHLDFEVDPNGKYIKAGKITYYDMTYTTLFEEDSKYVLVDDKGTVYNSKGVSVWRTTNEETGEPEKTKLNLDDYKIIEK